MYGLGRLNLFMPLPGVKRSPNGMANWALASDRLRAGMVHSFSDRFKTRNSNSLPLHRLENALWRERL